MAMDSLILVANPGSASRKYALFDGQKCLVKIHFEYSEGEIVYSLETDGGFSQPKPAGISHLTFASSKLMAILEQQGLTEPQKQIKTIGLRIVAPSSYFQEDRLLDKPALERLGGLEPRASLHINASLQEAPLLQKYFPDARLAGISDSAFHATLPDYARSYGIPAKTAEKLDIKRFGYHGLSVESAVQTLRSADKLPLRLVVCHLGSGSSVTAVHSGKSLDTSMGYSPLEGLIMATRSGNIDITAAQVLQDELKLSGQELQDYLNHRSGLLGISGASGDIRQLLKLEREGNERAALALRMYAHRVQQAIGQMSAVLAGIDGLVFTGTVGERSATIRSRIIEKLAYLGLGLDAKLNHAHEEPLELELISPAHHPVKIYIAPSDEYSIIVHHAKNL